MFFIYPNKQHKLNLGFPNSDLDFGEEGKKLRKQL